VPIQPKLAIGPARDRFESEADRAAEHVLSDAPGVPTITPVGSAPAMRMVEPEDETAQRAVKDEAEEPVQRMVDDEEPVQRMADDEEPVQRSATEEDDTAQRAVADEAEEETAQRDATGPTGAAGASVEAGVSAARGGGAPLPAETRDRMEASFGRDFSGVRVHDDSRAAGLSEDINARAFTTGSDIFFAEGAYAPGTSTGDRLLAHELAHVAQQTGPGQVQGKRVQRNENAPEDADEPELIGPKFEHGGETIDTTKSPMVFEMKHLQLPKIGRLTKGVSAGVTKTTYPGPPFNWTGKGSRKASDDEGFEGNKNPAQVDLWERPIRDSDGLRSALEKKVEDVGLEAGGKPVYFLRHSGDRRDSLTLTGTIDDLTKHKDVLRPPFSKSGKAVFHDVDHFWEIQLGGPHSIDNLWLLTSEANRSSGNDIKSKNVGAVKALADEADEQGFWDEPGNPSKPTFGEGSRPTWPDGSRVNIKFKNVETYGLNGSGWTKGDIESGEQVKKLRAIRRSELISEGLIPKEANGNPVRPKKLMVFSSPSTSFRKIVGVKSDDTLSLGRRKDGFIDGFSVTSTHYAGNLEPSPDDEIATIKGKAFVDAEGKARGRLAGDVEVDSKEVTVPIKATATEGFNGGYLDQTDLRASIKVLRAKVKDASPITFAEAGITDDFKLTAGGQVNADNPLFPGFTFDIGITGESIVIEAQIPVDKLKLGPFRATEAAMQIGADRKGLFLAGNAAFVIDGVGSGTLEANRMAVSGTMNFDIDAFDPAQLEVSYASGVWSGSTTLGIVPGKIPFVDSGTITAGFGEQGFSIDGTAVLAGPGIPEGTELTIAYVEETGEFTFGGDLPLDTANLPGLTNARVGFAVSRAENGGYSVSGSGGAAFELSGMSGNVDVAYDNGIITANGEATVNRPPLTGSANFHLSNQAVGEDGQPIEGPPLETFRVWGGGSASIEFGEYITATTGIQFLENGEIELSGTIALPPSITLIEATEYHYHIFDFPEVRFPIIGFTIPVIGTSFGVFGFVRGGLDANLALGPGELVDSEANVTYNPDHPEDMSITGGSTFEIGASADVGLTVTGGVGAGLAIVEATGEIGLRGALGLELSGGAAITLNWTPADGLSIDASVFGEAQPTFSISVVADARVVVDAALWSGTLWNESWERELGSIGPDMSWRAELPASWSEKDGLDVDINDLELTKPDIDLADLAEDVFDAIV
jgi:hypothetical protein